MYEVHLLKTQDHELWDAYVESHAQGTIFHTSRWLNALSEDVRVWVAERDGEIEGGIALAVTRKYGVAGYHIPPYTPYGGPLFGNGTIGYRCEGSQYSTFVQDVFAAVGKASQLDFTLPPHEQDLLPYKGAGFDVSVGLTHCIGDSEIPLYDRVHKGQKGYLKKLIPRLDSGGITVAWDDNRDAVFRLQEYLAERRGFNSHRHSLTSLISHSDPSMFRSVVLSTEQEKDVAGCICAKDQRRYYNLVAATRPIDDSVYRHIGVLMYFLMIQDALESGRIFDFEGSSLNGVARFYRRMGGQPLLTYRLQKTRSPYYAALRYARMLKVARSS